MFKPRHGARLFHGREQDKAHPQARTITLFSILRR
jgi:hypothetical protein